MWNRRKRQPDPVAVLHVVETVAEPVVQVTPKRRRRTRAETENDKVIEEQLAAQVREAALVRIRAAARAEFEAGRDRDEFWPQTRFIY
jgi:hypothetical protein